jgi:hypothetical protein
LATTLPAESDAAVAGDPEWEQLIERLTAIADGTADRTITPDDARRLLDRIGALQLWALERLASDFAAAVCP